MIHIDELSFPIGNGVTIPIVGNSQGKNYVIKTYNNLEGNRILINELICYRIAKQLALPIPDAYLGIVDEETNILQNVIDNEDFNQDCKGICFCSEYLENSQTISSSSMIKLCDNYKEIVNKIVLFDHLIYNKDRNKGNLLINSSNKHRFLHIIDHSHVFNLESIWTGNSLMQKINEEDFKDEFIMKNNKYIYSQFKELSVINMVSIAEEIRYFKSKLSDDFFTQVIDGIPEMWEDDKNELISLSKYLKYRFENIDYYANLICNINY